MYMYMYTVHRHNCQCVLTFSAKWLSPLVLKLPDVCTLSIFSQTSAPTRSESFLLRSSGVWTYRAGLDGAGALPPMSGGKCTYWGANEYLRIASGQIYNLLSSEGHMVHVFALTHPAHTSAIPPPRPPSPSRPDLHTFHCARANSQVK